MKNQRTTYLFSVILILLICVFITTSCSNSEVQSSRNGHKEQLISKTRYASNFGFYLSKNPGFLLQDIEENPQNYTEIQFYESKPESFEPETIVEGVIVAYSTEHTEKYLERLNRLIRLGEIIPEDYGFIGEITIGDLVERHEDVIVMLDNLGEAVLMHIYL